VRTWHLGNRSADGWRKGLQLWESRSSTRSTSRAGAIDQKKKKTGPRARLMGEGEATAVAEKEVV